MIDHDFKEMLDSAVEAVDRGYTPIKNATKGFENDYYMKFGQVVHMITDGVINKKEVEAGIKAKFDYERELQKAHTELAWLDKDCEYDLILHNGKVIKC